MQIELFGSNKRLPHLHHYKTRAVFFNPIFPRLQVRLILQVLYVVSKSADSIQKQFAFKSCGL